MLYTVYKFYKANTVNGKYKSPAADKTACKSGFFPLRSAVFAPDRRLVFVCGENKCTIFSEEDRNTNTHEKRGRSNTISALTLSLLG